MKITIPDNWNEVSVSKYQEICELEDDDNRSNSIIAILADIDDSEAELIDVDGRIKILERLTWVSKLPDETTYKRHLKINDIDFYLQDYNELKIGERISLKEHCKNSTKNLHKILSILYKPEKEIKNAHEMFLDNVMIGDVYGSFVFFYLIANKSIEILNTCLMEELKKDMIVSQMKNEKKD